MPSKPQNQHDGLLGRLEKIDLQAVWDSEAGDFTPWLAKEENLELLGETIGIELELEAQGKSVGPFRADILCKETTTDHWVLIENQLARTDHTHLGQLLTYAAGLEAVTIVWVAERFTEEHRAALDWLNEITDERFNFFGLEVELWRIGDSPIAPKFNLISKPNDWTKLISGAAVRFQPHELTETKQLQLEFWTELRTFLEQRHSFIKAQKPAPQHWMSFAIGRAKFHLAAINNTQDKRIEVSLELVGPAAKAHFHLLHREKEAIEAEFGENLEWKENPNKKTSRIILRHFKVDPTDRAKWLEQHEWITHKLEQFHSIFAPRIKKLDAKEYFPSDEPA